MKHYLVLDVGTTGVKAFAYNAKLQQISKAYQCYPVSHPHAGWVEQNPVDILKASKKVLKQAVSRSKIAPSSFVSFGITNQRETTILWDLKTGKPVYPAIVWEDERTRGFCRKIRPRFNGYIKEHTGLTIDPYFSATKIQWILEHVPTCHALASANRLLFGTVDSWLLWNLCEQQPHLTDQTNASRTLLFDIHTREWSSELLRIFGLTDAILPLVQPSASHFGFLKKSIVGKQLPCAAVIGDQQSSMFAAMHASRRSKNVTKVTYGTGVFLMQHLGKHFSVFDDFFTTLIPHGHSSVYALEAKIGVSGPSVEKYLAHPTKLRSYFYSLAKQVDRMIQRLPQRPTTLIIDGGSSRDGLITAIQEEVSGIPTQPLVSYDGTALGVATMLSLSKEL